MAGDIRVGVAVTERGVVAIDHALDFRCFRDRIEGCGGVSNLNYFRCDGSSLGKCLG